MLCHALGNITVVSFTQLVLGREAEKLDESVLAWKGTSQN
jgi:hypothetical protein